MHRPVSDGVFIQKRLVLKMNAIIPHGHDGLTLIMTGYIVIRDWEALHTINQLRLRLPKLQILETYTDNIPMLGGG